MMGGMAPRHATAHIVQNPPRHSSPRQRGTQSSAMATASNCIALVYLQRNPSATAKPASAQYPLPPGLISNASQTQYIAATQQKIDGGSIVMRIPPTLKIGITETKTAVQTAVALP